MHDTYSVEDILNMLDIHNDIVIQERGIELGDSITDIRCFLPSNSWRFPKNIMENCAVILCKKPDEVLEPYLGELLEWVADLNWPGAMFIYHRLIRYENTKALLCYINQTTEKAITDKDDIWLSNIWSILHELYFISKIDKTTLDMFKEFCQNIELEEIGSSQLINIGDCLGVLFPKDCNDKTLKMIRRRFKDRFEYPFDLYGREHIGAQAKLDNDEVFYEVSRSHYTIGSGIGKSEIYESAYRCYHNKGVSLEREDSNQDAMNSIQSAVLRRNEQYKRDIRTWIKVIEQMLFEYGFKKISIFCFCLTYDGMLGSFIGRKKVCVTDLSMDILLYLKTNEILTVTIP